MTQISVPTVLAHGELKTGFLCRRTNLLPSFSFTDIHKNKKEGKPKIHTLLVAALQEGASFLLKINFV